MQYTQHQNDAEYLIDIIFYYLRKNEARYEDTSINILSILYAYHKGYPIIRRSWSQIELVRNSDDLYNDLINESRINEPNNFIESEIWKELEQINRDSFNEIYPEVLNGLFDRLCSTVRFIAGEFYTPREITKLMAFIVKSENCTSIYDPFCGTASIAYELSDERLNVQFDGQEINQKIALFARVNLEAAYGTRGEVRVCDSTKFWNNQQYDAVVTCPPFNLILDEKDRHMMFKSLPHDFRYMESIVLTAPFHINKAKLSVVLAPRSLCQRGSMRGIGIPNRSVADSNYTLRRYLIEENLLDTVIALPSNILYGSSIPSVILICKKYREDDAPITFVHAHDYYLGEGNKRTLDVERLINMMATTREDCVVVKQSEIHHFDYNLNPALYVKKEVELQEGQQVVCLGDLITPIKGERLFTNGGSNHIDIPKFGENFIDILLNDSKVSPLELSEEMLGYCHFAASDKKYLLTLQVDFESRYGSFKNKFGIFTENESFNCPIGWNVYEVNESIVIPQYLAYILINNKALANNEIALRDYLSVPIVIDSLTKQQQLISKITQQYYSRVRAEQDADAKRLGIKQNISDLEHMLGTTQHRIGKIIERLENLTPEASNYHQTVKQLKDNVEYMNRIIQYSNANIDLESINKMSDDFVKYITSYVEGWNNYGRNCFDLTVVNELKESPLISFDKDMLTVMLDAILNNAALHGFNKRKKDGNRVMIRLSLVEHDLLPHLLVSIANNGEAMTNDFTLDDYISRGRYTASTGRSGLGGYHTYQIIKRHNGFLYLDSNKQWNVIVDVLLPIDSTSTDNMITYEHECI